jgi:hypothetical protein
MLLPSISGRLVISRCQCDLNDPFLTLTLFYLPTHTYLEVGIIHLVPRLPYSYHHIR